MYIHGIYIFSRLGPIFVGDDDKDTSKACNLTTFNKFELPPFGRPGKYDGIIEKYNFVPAEISPKVPFNEKSQVVKLNGLSLKWYDRSLRWACYGENEALKELDSKILDINKERCDFLAGILKNTSIFHGDALDQSLYDEIKLFNYYYICTLII